MNLDLDGFCTIVAGMKKENSDRALAVLWYHDHKQPDIAMTSGELTRIMSDHHVGTPHSTQLAVAIRKSKMADETKAGFSLKPGSRRIIREWLPAIDGIQPPMDHSIGYLAEPVWTGTRGYIESVCRQLNGCFQSAYYDAAFVMLRRLFETLIIEAYEQLNRSAEIKPGGNPLMFGDLVERATGRNQHVGLNLGRNTKNVLDAIKALGDRSAHDRRFNAHAPDLTKIQHDVRSGAQDLVSIAFPSRK